MKAIYPDKVTAVVADEEDANYPDDNVLDDYPKKVWRATSADARLTIAAAAGAEAIAVFNTNATSITVTIGTGISLTLQDGGENTPEDFTSYAEVDGPGKVTVTSGVVTLTDGDRDEDYHVTRDMGAGTLGNLFYWVDVNVSAMSDTAAARLYPWAIADAADDLEDIDSAGGSFIALFTNRSIADTHFSLNVLNVNAGAAAIKDTSVDIAVGTPLYLSIRRYGTKVVVEIYSSEAFREAGGPGDIDTIIGTGMVSDVFRYLYALGSYNDGTTGRSVTGTVSTLSLDPGTILTLQDGLTLVASVTLSVNQYDLDPGGVGALWAEYTAINYAHRIDIDFVHSDGVTVIEAGVVRAGEMTKFRDPKDGIREGLRDYSIVRELSNGAFYIRKRDVVRTFQFVITVTRDSDFYTFMRTIVQQRGPSPLAWFIVDNANEWNWVVYARPDGQLPEGTHDRFLYSDISVILVEVV